MTLLASITMPSFDAEELLTLRRAESVLAIHPYMRADLGESGPIGKELESVLSTRLAVQHTEGASEPSALLAKLRDWEAMLADALLDEEGSDEARLRYRTTRLLHPDPGPERTGAARTDELSALTEQWEGVRAKRSTRTVVAEKLAQNRDFFRHGALLPVYWLRRRRIRKLVPDVVMDNAQLRETFFAIEQIGPLVDNFAFKGLAADPIATTVGLADLAFLYMQLADEFLDELAAGIGGHDAAGRLVRSLYRNDTTERPLCDLTLGRLRQLGIWPDAHKTKFGLTLAELFDALEQVATVIDEELRRCDGRIRRATNLFLHHCFQTYLDEAELCSAAPGRCADKMPLDATAWHFYRKNNMVMMLWLDLRARLLGLEPAEHASVIRRWGYLLASFQIFDDLKDIALDLGKQPSYPLQIAANEFPDERGWIDQHFSVRRQPINRDEVTVINLNASGTVRRCMSWSRLIALAHFDNALLYAWDQRWRKSWTRRRGSLNPRGSDSHGAREHAVHRLVRALIAMRGADTTSAVADEQLAFALDTSAYEGSWQIYLALFPNIRAMYRFATLRMWMSAEEKARAARRLLRRYPRARANALVGLAEADVDHQIPGDRLEAFSKLIEV